MAIALSGSLVITGSIFATQGITGSFSGSATSASYADTLQGLGSASFAPAETFNTVSQSFATTSGSIAGRVTLIEGQYATTGSNTFTGPQYASEGSNAISFTSTASLYTDGGLRVAKNSFVSGTAYFNDVVVYGTSSIEYITSSQVNIGSNIITVNTDTPAIRFGGLSVFDSGSTGLTGSIFWDSEKNHWIYSNPSGSSYNSAMLMNGPRNTGSLGDEQGTLSNYIIKGQGGDHVTSSQIIDDGTTVRIPGALQVTGSITATSATFSSSVTATTQLKVLNSTGTALDMLVLETGFNNPSGNKSIIWKDATNTLGRISIDYDASYGSRMTFGSLYNGGYQTSDLLTIASTGAATFSSSVTANYLSSVISSSSNASPLILQNTAGWASSQITSVSVKDGSDVVGAIGWKYDGVGNVDMLFHSLYNGGYKNTSNVVMTVKGIGNVGIGTTNTSTEANLFLGGLNANEGGQLVLQKATSFASASHLDNYQNQFRVLSGTDTTSSAERLSLDMANGNLKVYGTSYLGTNILLSNSTGATSGQFGQTVSQEFGSTSLVLNLATLFPTHTFTSRGLSVIIQVLGLSDGSNGTSVLINGYKSIGGTWVLNTVSTSQNGSTGVSSVSGSGNTITINFNTTAFGAANITIVNRQ